MLDNWVILAGNLFDGVRPIGPFKTAKDAEKYIKKHTKGKVNWRIRLLLKPDAVWVTRREE